MSSLRLHVLYEHGPDPRPNGSAYLRLLRPLSHPSLRGLVEAQFALNYGGQPVDAVIVDRLWRPDVSLPLLEQLHARVQAAGARLIYALDDSFLDAAHRLQSDSGGSNFESRIRQSVEFLLRESDGLLVTSEALRARLTSFNRNICVLPHALDEHLLNHAGLGARPAPFGPRRKTIGYMGTPTHDDDLRLVLPALERLRRRHGDLVSIEIIGGVADRATLDAFSELPIRIVDCAPGEHEYPLFMLWYTSTIRWDIAIAPLADDPFNHCKSDIKLLDYAAVGAAGVFSRIPAYEASIRHERTGLLVENDTDAWVAALEQLLLDDAQQAQIASAATRYLYTQRTLQRSAVRWPAAIRSLLTACEGRLSELAA